MTSDDTYYEGSFTGLNEVNGKGTMVMSNGDSISGTFDGSWTSGIKVSGTYRKDISAGDMISLSQRLPKLFGTLSTRHDMKWIELFHHSKVALGCQKGALVSNSDCERAWEKVAVLFANLRTRQASQIKKRLYSEQLEKIPPHDVPTLSLEHYRNIRKYLIKACDCDLHPLGLLLANLVDVYRTSYSGTGTHHRLLLHAREELLSITHRYYDVIRILFPELPEEHSARKILSEASLRHLQHTCVTDNVNNTDNGASATSHMTKNLPSDIPLEEQQPDTVVVDERVAEESEVITPTLLIFPLLMSKIYEPLFHLYALQNEATDEQYWSRIQKFNKQCDLTLLSYLGIPERFWISNNGSVIDSSPKSMEIKDECYVDAIDMLQRMSTCLTPAEKLHAVQLTFDKINKLVKEKLTEEFVWSMDDLFPVFLFVVIRSRLRYLGSEIQLMDDLMDGHLEYGELGLMFTTLKACHLQIQTEKLL